MYEYRPVLARKKEQLIALFLGIFGFGCYLLSLLPDAPYPSVIQLIAVLALVGMIALLGGCLLRSFCYTVAPRENASEGMPFDLTVTELYGRRRKVVCLISVADVKRAVRCSKENRKECKKMTAGASVYRYVGSLWEGERYLLEVEHEGERFFLQIHANSALIEAILRR